MAQPIPTRTELSMAAVCLTWNSLTYNILVGFLISLSLTIVNLIGFLWHKCLPNLKHKKFYTCTFSGPLLHQMEAIEIENCKQSSTLGPTVR